MAEGWERRTTKNYENARWRVAVAAAEATSCKVQYRQACWAGPRRHSQAARRGSAAMYATSRNSWRHNAQQVVSWQHGACPHEAAPQEKKRSVPDNKPARSDHTNTVAPGKRTQTIAVSAAASSPAGHMRQPVYPIQARQRAAAAATRQNAGVVGRKRKQQQSRWQMLRKRSAAGRQGMA